MSATLTPTPPERKCCRKCAFRTGSPERSDPWIWMRLLEGWDDGEGPFYCHESAPGHPQEVKDDRPRMRVCAGYAATRKVSGGRLMRLGVSGANP